MIAVMPVATRMSMSKSDTDAAYAAAQKVVETHRVLAASLRPGQTLGQIDGFIASTLDRIGCKSCFFGYKARGHPKFPSFACLSLNDCVVHGTAASCLRPMREGDVLKIDIGVTYRGWVGDAGWTYVFGEPSPHVRKLMDSGKESLRRGVMELRPGNVLRNWAQTVQQVVEKEYGFFMIKGLGGHGYGRTLHAAPYVANTVPTYANEWPDASRRCEPGMLLAVEPMIGAGTGNTRTDAGQWPVYTADGSLAVHYEHDVLITENGPRVLTEGLDEIPDVIA